MSAFEFLFSLFGLLLGFTLVEVLSGLVRTVKAGRPRPRDAVSRIRVGWLTPLLGLFVLLDITSYWENVWGIRTMIPVGLDTIFAGLLITGIYYFAASMVFPDEADDWPDLDEWFWRHRRQVLGCILGVNLVWVSIYTTLNPTSASVLVGVAFQALYFVPLAIAVFARNRWVVAASLGFLSLVYFALGIFSFAMRFR